jgi:hypothetical protein
MQWELRRATAWRPDPYERRPLRASFVGVFFL